MTEETTPAVHSAPFLSRIALRNFKSVVGQDVSLAPLTLIVGENSSGKSSLFQGVRLMQQAARSKTPGDSFPLNGDSISVGSIEDVRSVQTEEEKSVSIRFDMCIPYSYFDNDYQDHLQNECRDDIDYSWMKEPPKKREDCSSCIQYHSIDDYLRRSREDSFFSIGWQVGIGAGKSGSTALRAIHFGLTGTHGEGTFFNTGIMTRQENSRTIDGNIGFYHFNGLDIDYTKEPTQVQVRNLDLSGPLPNDSIIYQYSAYRLAVLLIGLIISNEPMLEPSSKGARKVLKKVIEALEETQPTFKLPKAIYEMPELIDLIKTQDTQIPCDPNFGVPKIASDHSSLVTKIADLLVPEKETWSTYWSYGANEVLIAGARYLDILCDDNIKYLGLLRESPEKLTPRASLGQAGDIGPSGEFTASVLQRFGNDTVLAPTPDDESSEMPLIEAVQEWGRYLRLLRSIRVVQEAKLGNVITVENEGLNKEVPLDAVGVGVSQLLPVLVLCLLSKPGSMILLEQPELHLHPALQQRLADFLIAAARSGRQLIVETHSEYIVSRLRRRIAEDTSDEDELLSMSKIVFAERDPQTGVTAYREVELSPFGKIEDWPRGFFDQASEEEREIIRSGFRKIAEREDRLTEPE